MTHRATRMTCKSWRCPSCARKLAAKWFRKLEKVEDVRLAVTLTFDPRKYADPDDCEQKMGKNFSNLLKRMRRMFGVAGPGSGIEFARFTEWHKGGWPHLHVLFRGRAFKENPELTRENLHNWLRGRFEDWERVDGVWELKDGVDVPAGIACGFGFRVRVDDIYDGRGAANYALKDVTKTYQVRDDYRKGLRRVVTSQRYFEDVDLEALEREKPDQVEILPGVPLERVVEVLREQDGLVVEEEYELVGEETRLSSVEIELPPDCGESLETFRLLVGLSELRKPPD